MEFLDADFLQDNEIKLIVDRVSDADPIKGWVPAYYFSICDKDGNKLGFCDLRVGYSDGLYFGGHIGYTIYEEHRGHHYAGKACKLMFELAKKHGMEYLYITCDQNNIPSKKTLDYLGGEFLEIAELPEDNDMRVNDGQTHVYVYKFDLTK